MGSVTVGGDNLLFILALLVVMILSNNKKLLLIIFPFQFVVLTFDSPVLTKTVMSSSC